MSIKDEVVQVFRTLHIDTVSDGDTLGRDLGIDSQELVSLACELESRFGLKVGGHEVHQRMTVADVAALMAGKVAAREAQTAPDAGKGSLVEQIVIDAPWRAVYERLFRVEAWPQLLPHVDRIDVIYDDGRYQEFTMTVRSAGDSIVRVRSIRRCGEREILFFQPEPPKYLTRHAGGWTFEAMGEARCAVTTRHEWVLNDNAADTFPATDSESTGAQVTRLLRDHARLALNSWKTIVEGQDAHDSGTDSNRCPAAARV